MSSVFVYIGGLLLIVAVSVFVVVGIVVASRRSTASRAFHGYQVPPIDPNAPTGAPPEQLVERVRFLVGEGKKILAIKELRAATGLGLLEAKQVADAIEEGRPVPHLPATWTSGAGPAIADHHSSGDGAATSLADRARSLKSAGDVSGAITMVRGETGMTEEEAGSFVAAL